MLVLNIVLLTVSVIVFFVLASKSILITNEGHFNVIERLGRFHGVRRAGLSFKIPFVDKVRGVYPYIRESYFDVSATTKDGVKTKTRFYAVYRITDDNEGIARSLYNYINTDNLVKSSTFSEALDIISEIDASSYYSEKSSIANKTKEYVDLVLSDCGYDLKLLIIVSQEIVDDERAKSISLSRKDDYDWLIKRVDFET